MLKTTHQRYLHRAAAILLLIACIPAPIYLTLPNSPLGSAIVGAMWGGAAVAIPVLWRADNRGEEDPRTVWRRLYGVTLLCGLIMAAGIVVTVSESIATPIKWTAVAIVGLAGTLGMISGMRGGSIMSGADRDAIADELWWANKHRAGYWACLASGAAGGVITLLLMIDWIEPSALAVAVTLTFAIWITFGFFQFWFEWRTDV